MYLTFDCETGGIGKDKSLLTAYFGLFDSNGYQVKYLNLELKPDDGVYHVTAQGLAINQINLVEHDKSAISYKVAKGILYDFLKTSYELVGDKLIPVGHNCYFDIEMLQEFLISRGSWEQFVSYRILDTLPIARFLQLTGKINTPNGVSLKELIDYFKIEVDGKHHEAKYDALATLEVLKKMIGLVS